MARALGVWLAAVGLAVVLTARTSAAQAVAGPEKAKPVQGDPGIASMVVLDRPEFRILRDYAEPGATRRMHAHADATYQVFVLVTGQLQLTVSHPPRIRGFCDSMTSVRGLACAPAHSPDRLAVSVNDVVLRFRRLEMWDVERSYGAQRRQERSIDLGAAARGATLPSHLFQGPQHPCPIKPLPLTVFAKAHCRHHP